MKKIVLSCVITNEILKSLLSLVSEGKQENVVYILGCYANLEALKKPENKTLYLQIKKHSEVYRINNSPAIIETAKEYLKLVCKRYFSHDPSYDPNEENAIDFIGSKYIAIYDSIMILIKSIYDALTSLNYDNVKPVNEFNNNFKKIYSFCITIAMSILRFFKTYDINNDHLVCSNEIYDITTPEYIDFFDYTVPGNYIFINTLSQYDDWIKTLELKNRTVLFKPFDVLKIFNTDIDILSLSFNFTLPIVMSSYTNGTVESVTSTIGLFNRQLFSFGRKTYNFNTLSHQHNDITDLFSDSTPESLYITKILLKTNTTFQLFLQVPIGYGSYDDLTSFCEAHGLKNNTNVNIINDENFKDCKCKCLLKYAQLYACATNNLHHKEKNLDCKCGFRSLLKKYEGSSSYKNFLISELCESELKHDISSINNHKRELLIKKLKKKQDKPTEKKASIFVGAKNKTTGKTVIKQIL